MSRAYEAKLQALDAYPDDREKAIDLFIGYVGMDESDLEYEFGQTVEMYIFGDEITPK